MSIQLEQLSPEETTRLIDASRTKVKEVVELSDKSETYARSSIHIENQNDSINSSRLNTENNGRLESPISQETSRPLLLDEPSQDKLDEILRKPVDTVSLAGNEKYIALQFENPAEMLTFFDDNLKNGIVSWHSWQLDINEFVAQDKFTNKSPLKFLLVACNGSGKDAYIIAPFAIWHCLCKIRSRCIITSSSYSQLEAQTQSYIRTRCYQINQWCKDNLGMDDVFLIKKDHIVCTLTHSEIKMFSTDDPGKAEGYHPFPDYPQGELCIIVNEAKSVGETIFEALSRCTFNRWLLVSSPGKTAGRLYNNYRVAVEWPQIYQSGYYYSIKVTSFQCPHKSLESIESDRREYGENSPIYRSKHLAEFTSLDEQTVVSLDQLNRCLNFPPEHRKIKSFRKRAGLDIAKGGDENVLTVVEGNKVIALEAFRAIDLDEVTAPAIDALLTKHQVSKEDIINADDGGVGSGLIDILRNRYGWKNINRVMNQSPPIVKNGGFGNRGAELWFRAGRIISECLIDITLLKTDDRFKSQLTSRYYKQHETQGKIILESKKEAKSKGHGSPDRADSLVLALADLTIHDFTDDLDKPLGVKTKTKERNLIGKDKVSEFIEERRFEKFNILTNSHKKENTSFNPSNILKQCY